MLWHRRWLGSVWTWRLGSVWTWRLGSVWHWRCSLSDGGRTGGGGIIPLGGGRRGPRRRFFCFWFLPFTDADLRRDVVLPDGMTGVDSALEVNQTLEAAVEPTHLAGLAVILGHLLRLAVQLDTALEYRSYGNKHRWIDIWVPP